MQTACPEIHRVNHRRNEQRKWRRSPEWKEFVRVHTAGQVCAHCGCAAGEVKGDRKPAVLTVNHTSRRKYISKEEYLTWDDDCEVSCTTCNWMYEKGLKPCPRCGVRYIPWMETLCLTCYLEDHPEYVAVLEKARERKREFQKLRSRGKTRKRQYLRHPCKFRKLDQGCRRGSGSACGYTDKKAHLCPTFKQKSVEVVPG